MKTFKLTLALIFSLIVFTTSTTFANSLSTQVLTVERNSLKAEVIYEVGKDYVTELVLSEEEISKEFSKQDAELLNNLVKSSSNDVGINYIGVYEYETVYSDIREISMGGYFANQLQGGYSFPNGGGINVATTGGTTVSASVSFPAPFDFVSISVNIGSKLRDGLVGTYIAFPANSNYYKAYALNSYRIRPYIIYEIDPRDNTRREYTRGCQIVLYSSSQYPKLVQ